MLSSNVRWCLEVSPSQRAWQANTGSVPTTVSEASKTLVTTFDERKEQKGRPSTMVVQLQQASNQTDTQTFGQHERHDKDALVDKTHQD